MLSDYDVVLVWKMSNMILCVFVHVGPSNHVTLTVGSICWHNIQLAVTLQSLWIFVNCFLFYQVRRNFIRCFTVEELFVWQAYSINSRCTQALLLKGTALQELNRMQDALLHFHEAVTRAPHRFETYQGLVYKSDTEWPATVICFYHWKRNDRPGQGGVVNA